MTSRRNEEAKGKESWIHSVMEGTASSAALTSSMQTRYATECGSFQPPCEISALRRPRARRVRRHCCRSRSVRLRHTRWLHHASLLDEVSQTVDGFKSL